MQAGGGAACLGRANSLLRWPKTLGLSDHTLHTWLKAEAAGGLRELTSKAVSAEPIEIARLKAELAKTRMEHDILKKSDGVFREGSRGAIRLYSPYIEGSTIIVAPFRPRVYHPRTGRAPSRLIRGHKSQEGQLATEPALIPPVLWR